MEEEDIKRLFAVGLIKCNSDDEAYDFALQKAKFYEWRKKMDAACPKGHTWAEWERMILEYFGNRPNKSNDVSFWNEIEYIFQFRPNSYNDHNAIHGYHNSYLAKDFLDSLPTLLNCSKDEAWLRLCKTMVAKGWIK